MRHALALGALTTEGVGEQLKRIGKSKSYEIGIANGLWPRATSSFNAEYISQIRKHFDADLEPVDFAKDPEAAKIKINKWVKAKTREKIKEVIANAAPLADAKFILANAIYFKAKWAVQFERDFTKDMPFHVSAKRSVKVPMMSIESHFQYFEDDQKQALRMDYEGGEVYFLAVLPKAGQSLGGASPLKTDEMTRQMDKPAQNVSVHLPRFKIEAELGAVPQKLKALGIKRIFEPLNSQLGKIAVPAEGPLFVSNILHKALIEVDEGGTEAAAATVVEMASGSMFIPEKPVVFKADRPFRFYVVHAATKSVLFAGQYWGE